MFVRRILGTLAGIITAGVVVGLVEASGHSLFPPPPGTDLRDPAALAAIMDRIPLGAKLAVLLAWFAGSVAGAWAGALVARWRPAAWVVAGFVVAGGVASMLQIPHPWWMAAAGLLLPWLGAWLALRHLVPDLGGQDATPRPTDEHPPG